MSRFPELPIVSPDPPRKTQVEKYGGLFYLSLAGLAVLLSLIAWFAAGLWSMKSVWADIYVLNDPRASELTRVNAAWKLSANPNVNQQQRWDLALSQVPPDVGRYLLAESLSSELVNKAPRAYALAIARSEGWPDWLRLILARPLAAAASEGTPVDPDSLEELHRSKDPLLRMTAVYALAVQLSAENPKRQILLEELQEDRLGPFGKFASELADSLQVSQPARAEHLRAATGLIRSTHPQAARVWNGWVETPTGLLRRSNPPTPE